MAISAYINLLPSMAVRLPDCESEMIQQALWSAGRTFCLESESYIQELDAIDSVADQKEYAITTPTQFDILRIFEVRIRSATEVTAGDDGTVKSPSYYDYHYSTGVLEFFTAPFVEVVTDGLVVEAVLAPQEGEDDTELDFDWIRRYGDYIKAGAFAQLFSMLRAPWASPGEYELEYRKFRQGIGYARREVKTRGTTRPLRLSGKGWL